MRSAMKRRMYAMFAAFCALVFAGAEAAGTREAEKKKAEPPAMKIAVLDFTCIDLTGQKLRLVRNRPVNTDYRGILSSADRQSIDDRMQGFVRMLDARFAGTAAMAGIRRDLRESERDRAEREALAKKILNSKQRPLVIGAEYMTASLGEYPEIFSPANREGIESALKSLDFGRAQTAEDADRRIREFMEKSGATHILTGTVADLKTEHKKFSGYGVRTDRVVYSLDVLVKLIDLKTSQIAFSGVFTGEVSQMNTKFAQTINDSLFQDLMKDAVKQAAEAMSRRFAADGK